LINLNLINFSLR